MINKKQVEDLKKTVIVPMTGQDRTVRKLIQYWEDREKDKHDKEG